MSSSIHGLRAEFHPSKVEIRVRVPVDALFCRQGVCVGAKRAKGERSRARTCNPQIRSLVRFRLRHAPFILSCQERGDRREKESEKKRKRWE